MTLNPSGSPWRVLIPLAMLAAIIVGASLLASPPGAWFLLGALLIGVYSTSEFAVWLAEVRVSRTSSTADRPR